MTSPRRSVSVRGGALAGVAALALGRAVVQRVREADLSGQVVLITGGSRGLGLLLADEFGSLGCQVVICARDADELDRARIGLEQRGHEVLTVTADVSDAADVDRLVRETSDRFGPVDVLINNAGTIGMAPIATVSLRDAEYMLENVLRNTIAVTLAVLPSMLERRRGRIVDITSIGGRLPAPQLAAYAAAKSGMIGWSHALRAELAREGITVTTIVPGLMRTGSFLNATFKEPLAAEYGIFSTIGSLPVLSTDARRAARRIVAATRRGEADVTLGLPWLFVTRLHGLFPGLTTDIAALGARLLPRPDGVDRTGRLVRGEEVGQDAPSAARDTLAGWGHQAADRLGERHDDPTVPRLG